VNVSYYISVFFIHLHQIFMVNCEQMGIVVTTPPLTIVFHLVANVRMSSVAVHKSVSAETTCERVTVHWYCTACVSAPVLSYSRFNSHSLTHTQCGTSFWGNLVIKVWCKAVESLCYLISFYIRCYHLLNPGLLIVIITWTISRYFTQ